MILKQHQIVPWAAVSVLLGVLVDVSSGMMSIQLIPQDPVIGGSVTMSVAGITGRIWIFIWYKGLNTDSAYQILIYFPHEPSPIHHHGRLFHSRVTPFSNGSLQISNLNRTDEGNYTVRIQTDKQNDISVYLKIYESTDPTNSVGNNFTIVIVIAVVLLLVLFAVSAYFFARHRQHKNMCSTQDKVTRQPKSANNEGPDYENVNDPQSLTSKTALPGTRVPATQESHYEQLTHKDRAIYSTLASKAGKH